MFKKELTSLMLIVFFTIVCQLKSLSQGISPFTLSLDFNVEPIDNSFYGNLIVNANGATIPNGFTLTLRWPSLKDFIMNQPAFTENGTGQCDTKTITFDSWMIKSTGINVSASGHYNTPYLLPPYAIDNNGDTVLVVLSDPKYLPQAYNQKPKEFHFKSECFIPSPDKLCLGEAQFREWNEVWDVRVPENRISWAIASAHSQRLFNNMIGAEVTSLNYVMAQAMIEGRMACDQGAIFDQNDNNPGGYWSISEPAGCMQIVTTGWEQLKQFYPSLYDANGLQYNDFISGKNFVTAALSKAMFDMTTFSYFEKKLCSNPIDFMLESADPYFTEEFLAIAYHDGNEGAWSSLEHIFTTNRTTAVNDPNLASLIMSSGLSKGYGPEYAERMRNNLIQLENNFSVDGGAGLISGSAQINWKGGKVGPPADYEYHGCYNEPVSWADMEAYIDDAHRLFWTGDIVDIKARVRTEFDRRASGGSVMYEDLGSVIDTMVMAFPAYSTDEGLGTDFTQQLKACGSPAVVMSSCDEICPGETGELWIHCMGVPPFTYSILAPDGNIITRTTALTEVTDVVLVKEPGVYKILDFNDANGTVFMNCHNSSAEIKNAGDAKVAWNKDRVDGNGCSNGNLELDIEGNGPWLITYTKDGGNEIDLVIPLNATMPFSVPNESPATGTQYILTHMVAGGCDSDLDDTINFCSDCVKPQLELLTTDTAVCNGDTVAVQFKFIGNADYSLFYHFDGNQFNNSGISTDDFTIPITSSGVLIIDSLIDATCKNDTLTNKLEITVNPIPDFSLGKDTTICSGPITFSTNTSGANSYEWNNASTDPTLTVNSSGDYWVIVTENNCSDTDSITLDIGGELPIDLGLDTTLCLIDAPLILTVGSFDVVEWNGVSGGVNYDVITTSTINVHVVDIDGCEGWDTVEVVLNSMPIVALRSDTSLCPFSAPLTLNAKNTGATYLWNLDALTSQTIDVNKSGIYKVKVTENGCSTEDSVSVTILDTIDIDLGPDTTFCSDLGNYEITIDPSFKSYRWSNNDTTQSISIGTSSTIEVEVENSFGCVGKDTVVVTIIPTPSVDLGKDISICPNSSPVTFDAKNIGADFLWNSGETSQTILKGSLEDGEYSVIVTKDGCHGYDTVNLQVSTELAVDLGDDIEVCIDTLLDAGFGIGYNFEWSGNPSSINQTYLATAGEVTVIVSDTSGCKGTDTINIIEVNPLSIDLGVDRSICFGDTAEVFSMISNRTDINIIKWNDASTGYSLTANTSGEYWLEVDSSGCIAKDTVNLTVHDLEKINLGDDTTFCEGNIPTFTMDAGKFVSYQWKELTNLDLLGTNQTQIASNVGVYEVMIIDSNGCEALDTLAVLEELATQFSLGDDTTICPGGSAIISIPLNITGGSWQWVNDGSNGSKYTVSNQTDGSTESVILEYKNAFNCITYDSVDVKITNTLVISGLKDTTICEGEDVEIGSGYPLSGYIFDWQDGSSNNNFIVTNANSSNSGLITVNIISNEGCSGNASLNLIVNNNPIPNLADSTSCVGETIILDHGILNSNSIWIPTNDTTQTIEIASSGTYSVTVTDPNGCMGYASSNLMFNASPIVNLGKDQTLCEGDSFLLNTGFKTNDFHHQWNQSNTSSDELITIVNTGSYGVIVTDNLSGCSAGDTINFNFDVTPNLELGNDTNICEGDIFTLYATEINPNYIYDWTPSGYNSEIDISSSGIYSLTVSNGNCSITDDKLVTVIPKPISSLINDTVLCFEDLPNGLMLDPGRIGSSYLWSTSENTQVIIVNDPGVYLVEITNSTGCTIQDHVDIKEYCISSIWVPNAFTPQGDGTNDTWEIKGSGIVNYSVIVFNRWGSLIWESNDMNDSWDGTHMDTGNDVQIEVYAYKISYSYFDINGKMKSQEKLGTVTIIR